jgi:DNA-binding NtrC family response regulator
VVNLHLPPLRERPADLRPLAEHFAAKYAQANGLPPRPLSAAALARLGQQPWKGNVRELENCVHRAVLMASGEVIGPEAILLQGSAGTRQRAAAAGGPLVGRTVADVERALIIDTLQHTLGNRTHAATILGISIRTLRNKLRQYGEEGVAVPPPGTGGAEAAVSRA